MQVGGCVHTQKSRQLGQFMTLEAKQLYRHLQRPTREVNKILYQLEDAYFGKLKERAN